jgi:hypothetical protein
MIVTSMMEEKARDETTIQPVKKSTSLKKIGKPVLAAISNEIHTNPEDSNTIEQFWKSINGTAKPTQLQRYEMKKSPEYIKKFIAIGGGPKMGTTLEQYARFKFKNLQKRSKGKNETGYDHLINIGAQNILIEQKSSGHWGDDDYKWQHVEDKHKWNMLLLCGIDYTDIMFWGMDRKTFNRLISEKKITNQGNKLGESSEGVWFNFSDVKDSLLEIQTEEQLLQFASSLQASD